MSKEFSSMEATMLLTFLTALMEKRDLVDKNMQQFTAALLKSSLGDGKTMPGVMLDHEDVNTIGQSLASISMLLDLLCAGPERTMQVLFNINPTCVPIPKADFEKLTSELMKLYPAKAEPDPKKNPGGDPNRN